MPFLTGFCPLHDVCFNDIQISRWPHLSSSPWGVPLYSDLARKRTDQKNYLLYQQTTSLCSISCLMVFKISGNYEQKFFWKTSLETCLFITRFLFFNRSFELTILTWKNFCFTEFSTKIHWNTRLAASDIFHMFTQLSSFNSIIVTFENVFS